MLEHFVAVGQQTMRCGYTTGTCAAAAALAAAKALLNGEFPAQVTIDTPAGIAVTVEIVDLELTADHAACAVKKDGGDDIDATSGAKIRAVVSRIPAGIEIDGGAGVGRVTKAGLDQPVGAAAINSTPRRMIGEQMEAVMAKAGYTGGLRAVISVPEGEALAKRTFNPRLGIVGGISILGTSGIVKPMSEAALLDSLYLEMDQRRAAGVEDLLLTPGNYGESFAREVLSLNLHRWCMCSNYLGAAIDHAAGAGFRSVLVVGHLGKLIKAAAGCMNTHSKTADARRETLTAHAALAGADRALLRALFDSPTTDAGVELLKQAGLLEPVMASIGEALDGQLKRRAGERLAIEALFFSNQYGILGKTPGAERLLALNRAAPDGETAGG